MVIKAHHNPEKYPGQNIMYVMFLQKIYLVPYVVERDGAYFLKTIYPSQKAGRQFLGPGSP